MLNDYAIYHLARQRQDEIINGGLTGRRDRRTGVRHGPPRRIGPGVRDRFARSLRLLADRIEPTRSRPAHLVRIPTQHPRTN
ncbi:hypothetical protein [Actinopolymorpha alba]|uniref:hypothetical protein n=1 Tax=Actinopolymorpha alba TaxID=533267 RepID=UPI0003696FD2|nr:hypothetical protein [Actinopolymorpha alba]